VPLLSIVKALQDEELAIFEKSLSKVSFSVNSCILGEGDLADGCYIIDEGTVRLEIKDKETDTDNILDFLEAGSFLGELSLLDN